MFDTQFGRMLSVATVAAATAVTLAAAIQDADAKTRWKFAYSYASTMRGHGDIEQRLTEKFNTLGEGFFQVKPYEPGALMPPLGYFDAISVGSLDSTYAGYGFWTGKAPALALFSAFPFGPDGLEYNAWFKYGNGNKLMDKVAATFNHKAIVCGTHSPEASGWFRKEIKSLDDLKGLKMRIFGLGGRTIEKLGVNSQITAAGDIYAALERGVIDAAEFSMPMMDLSMGFYEIAKHYYFPGWHQTYSPIQLIMNRDKWNALDKKTQMLIETVCESETLDFLTMGEAKNAEAIETLKGKGVQIHRWSDEILGAFKKSWEEVADEYVKSDATFAEVWNDLNTFRASYAQWNALAKP